MRLSVPLVVPEELDRPAPLEVPVVDVAAAERGRPFYLFDRDAPAEAELPRIEATCALDAMEGFHPPESYVGFYHCSGQIMLYHPDTPGPRPEDLPGPSMVVALLRTGARLLVSEADWAAGAAVTHAALWRTFTRVEKHEFERLWQRIERWGR